MKQRQPAGALIVDQAGDAPFEVRLDRDDVAPAALRDDRFLQIGRRIAVADDALQLLHQPVVYDAHVAADIGQGRRGGIAHFAFIVDAA